MIIQEVNFMRRTPEQIVREYRIIYELLWKEPRLFVNDISPALKIDRSTAGKRLLHAFDEGYILKPQMRRRSFSNFLEYIYLLKCDRPNKAFSDYTEDRNVSYHAKLLGSPNLLVMSKTKIDSEYNIFEGIRSDFHVSFAPDHSWDTTIDIMWEKIKAFNPRNYTPEGILQTHWNETIDWDSEYEDLFRILKYDLRQSFTPIRKKTLISSGKFYDWLRNLETYCTVFTLFYPDSISGYDPYVWIFESDYEDFLINLFSELPTSVIFFKVDKKIFIFTHIERQYVRTFDFCKPRELQILLLVDKLQDRGIVKSEEHTVIECYWRKEI